MLTPLSNRILVKTVKSSNKTTSGLIIPDTVESKSMEGHVVSVGPGKWKNGKRMPMYTKVNDRVVFGSWSATEIKINRDEYVIMTEDDIIGILR